MLRRIEDGVSFFRLVLRSSLLDIRVVGASSRRDLCTVNIFVHYTFLRSYICLFSCLLHILLISLVLLLRMSCLANMPSHLPSR